MILLDMLVLEDDIIMVVDIIAGPGATPIHVGSMVQRILWGGVFVLPPPFQRQRT